ncbi:MAG: SNF2-related protein [Polyangiales bacterium]
MKALLEAVRKKCPSGLWSQGVKLAREGSVVRESGDGSQVTLRVRAPRFAIPPTVTLYPEDLEWSCDCGGKIDPCEHVAAAIIAATQPNETPKKEGAHVGYRLTRQNDSLYLERVIGEVPLKGGLAGLLARGAGDLVPTHDDLAIDRIAGNTQRTFVPVVRMQEIFALLATCKDVTLDGQPIRSSGDAIAPRAVVYDGESSVVLRIERDPRVTDVVARGVVRLGEILHPIREAELTGDLLEKLPRSRTFETARFPELVTQILPDLEARIDVEVKSKRLPRRARTLKPRILLELGSRPGAREATLGVVPLLVYGDPPIARVDGDKLVHLVGTEIPARDEAAEKRLLARLRDELDLVPGRRVDFLGPDAQRFAAKLKSWAVHDPESTIEGTLVPKLDGERFDLRFESADGQRHASAEAALRAFRDGLDLVPLEGGGFAPLPLDWLQKHGSRLSDLFAAKDARGELPKAAELQVARLYAALDQPPPPRFQKLAALLQDIEKLPEPSFEVNATLRPYQHAGVRWLSFLRDAGLGAILADDMGLGKTLQTICALKGRTLVVCPKSVLHNWAEEIAKFRPSLRTSRYHGPKRVLDHDADVVITTYAVLRLDTDLLTRQHFDIVVLDEAQFIKNPESQAARAAYALDASWRLALSGTPVENRLDELWSLFHFASPGLLGGRSDFADRLAGPIARGEEGSAERLREIVKPFLLRRKKRDVAPELPPRTDVVLHVELDEQERAVYDTVRAATTKDIVERMQSGGVLAALEALLRLRQAACHPALVPGQKGFESSSKVDTLVERLEDAAAEGHKALVFSQWTSLLDLIEPQLKAHDVAFTRLDGSTHDRGAVVAKFQADDGPPVMLV